MTDGTQKTPGQMIAGTEEAPGQTIRRWWKQSNRVEEGKEGATHEVDFMGFKLGPSKTFKPTYSTHLQQKRATVGVMFVFSANPFHTSIT